ncbi:lytic transglycosylase domain-containing protein [Asaia platycodi]|uniref:lytic transglycosylase domain-containing protein n=1 Tax=Asaia platycodi TaxID=610243 RepID=UPI000AEC0ADB
MTRSRRLNAKVGQEEAGRFLFSGLKSSRLLMITGAAALLSACASGPQRPQIPVAQEAADYREHAKSYYAPPGPPEDPWGPYIEEASQRFDVPGTWIRSVMMQESGGRLYDRNGQFTTSAPGAMGLMQLMPPTYDDMRSQYNLGDDAYDPRDNIMAGTAYIRQMYDIYGSPGFLAAYNDGPGSLDSYLRRGRSLPRETRRYVAHVGPQIAGIWPRNRSAATCLSHSTILLPPRWSRRTIVRRPLFVPHGASRPRPQPIVPTSRKCRSPRLLRAAALRSVPPGLPAVLSQPRLHAAPRFRWQA